MAEQYEFLFIIFGLIVCFLTVFAVALGFGIIVLSILGWIVEYREKRLVKKVDTKCHHSFL